MTASAAQKAGGYDPAFFEQLAQIEDRHFWFCARNRLIFQLASRIAASLPAQSLVVEVGCGTGNVLRVLRRACSRCVVVGLELWFEGLRYAKRRSAGELVQGDVRSSPFGKPIHLLGMFDVLEHVEEERETLTSIWNGLAPGGVLLLTVPAHRFLWSYFDEAAHHCRRYSVGDLRRKLAEAGFEVEFVTQFMASIFPLVWVVRKLRRSSSAGNGVTASVHASDEFRLIPVMNGMLRVLLNLEADWVSRGHRLPFGTSLLAIARKSVDVARP